MKTNKKEEQKNNKNTKNNREEDQEQIRRRRRERKIFLQLLGYVPGDLPFSQLNKSDKRRYGHHYKMKADPA